MTKKLLNMSRDELVAALRRDVGEWNRLRRAEPSFIPYLDGAYLRGAYLRGAYLRGAYLRGAYLGGANLGGAYLRGANLDGANLDGAYLRGAYLRGADLDGADLENATIAEHTLTGKTAAIGTVAGYEVRLFATTTGHILHAGCWTGTLDQAEARAIEEKNDALTRAEAAAVIAHGHAILAAWGAEA